MRLIDRQGRQILAFVLVSLTFGAAPALFAEEPAVLPGTKPLTATSDLSAQMRKGIDRFIRREAERAAKERGRHWKRDLSSAEAYARSITANRERLRRMIGLVDERLPFTALDLIATTAAPALVAETETFRVFAVRWPVLDGVHGEGLFLRPTGEPRACVIALPDADQTPEQLAGLAAGLPVEGQIARRLAAAGCQVVVPALIDRSCELSGHPDVWMTNQPHREWINRPAFELGRHIIGYEVQKVLALVDWLRAGSGKEPRKIGVAGYGEGGLVALYAAAVDSRIDAVLVSGYFDRREQLWREPIYRNVFGLLREFGDAEIAGMVVPRPLLIEYSPCPQVVGPPAARAGCKPYAAPGVIRTPSLASVRSEMERARSFFPADATVQPAFQLINGKDDRSVGPFSTPAITAFAKPLGVRIAADAGKELTAPKPHPALDAVARQRRQVRELVDYTQALIPRSAKERARFWNKARPTTADAWPAACKEYKAYFWEEVVGRFPPASEPINARTRKILEREKWTAYEVMLDVWPDVFCWGILLIPRSIKDGEKRPVVVCQHGLEGVPRDTLDDDPKSPAYAVYRAFAARLAERGFITFAPQNCYRGGNDFRQLQRKLHPLKRSLCSIFLAQHDRHLDWLASLPFVDASRIGFYGLSYGGYTAVHVPPLLDRYALAISSAEFNDMVRKAAGIRDRYSYPFYNTYEIFEFNKANTFGYGDLAGMMAPRPFMVERGHHDTVAPDEWVASEYAKVRRLYAALGIPERTTIEFFNGGHVINGVESFSFLHRRLRWPQPRELP
ncbi:MAG TPA: dienelactone hydrolase family protein [Gemmataceae bacterium]|nr:dienelactone hydrolase family protein [Gemmataceae bacterium]